MPEAPDLEVIKEFLHRSVVGCRVEAATVQRPTVVRSMVGAGEFAQDIVGRTPEQVVRRGKFLLIGFSGDRWLAINPMLTGALQYCQAQDRVLKKTCFILSFDQGSSGQGAQLRYLDDRQMGKVYYLPEDQLSQVPGLSKWSAVASSS